MRGSETVWTWCENFGSASLGIETPSQYKALDTNALRAATGHPRAGIYRILFSDSKWKSAVAHVELDARRRDSDLVGIL